MAPGLPTLRTPEPSFRDQLRSGALIVGTFVKTPTIHSIELLALAGMDFVVIDQEHAPFDRAATDATLFAARALGLPALVRVASSAPENLLAVLDCGATGVLVPHVVDAAQARAAAAACRYAGARGYSGSVRSAGYGGGRMGDVISSADAAVTVIAQIEDRAALDHVDAIAATDGIDALFIGRGDLAVSLGAEGSDAPAVRDAAERVAQAARGAGKAISVFVSGMAEARWLHTLGASAFVHSSDQSFLRQGATAAAAAVRELDTPPPAEEVGQQ